MVGIQSATAEIRRGKKKKIDRIKKPPGKNIMSASATQGGRNKEATSIHVSVGIKYCTVTIELD